MFKSTIQVTAFSAVTIIINFGTQLLLAYFFGAGQDRDAYYAAFAIPTYVAIVFTGSLGMLFIPFLIKQTRDNNPGSENQFPSAVINFTVISLFLIILACIIFANSIVKIIVPYNKFNLFEETVYLFRILMVGTLFTVLNNLLSSFLQARDHFLVPSLSTLFTSLMSISFVAALSPYIGISSVAYGMLFGGIVSFLFLLFSASRKMNFRWKIIVFYQPLLHFLIASVPLFAVGILFRSTTLFERYFAARLPEGSLSYLGSGNQIIVILSTLVSAGIATTSFPTLARHWSENNLTNLRLTFTKVINIIAVVVIPLVAVFIVSGRDVIRIIFEHGAFHASDTESLYRTLLGLMGFFLFSSMGNVVARILYIANHTRTAALFGCLELVIYIAGAYLLGGQYSFVGLAISMSLASGFNILVSLAFIRYKIIPIELSDLGSRMIIISVVSALSLIPVFLLHESWLAGASNVFRGVVTILLTLGLLWLMLVKIVKEKYTLLLMQLIQNKIKRND